MQQQAISSSTWFLFRDISRVSVPIVLAQFARVASSVAATLMAAKLGEDALAASALAVMVFIVFMSIIWGAFFSLSVLVSQAYGAGKYRSIGHIVRQGAYLAILITIPMMVVFWQMDKVLLFFEQSPHLVSLAKPYFYALVWGVLPNFLFTVLQQYLTGLGHTRIVMSLTFVTLPITVFVTYILAFGEFGFPKLGIGGIGWGVTISLWLSFIVLLLYVLFYRKYRRYHLLRGSFNIDLGLVWKIIKLGVPIGGLLGVETFAMLVAVLLIGRIGISELATFRVINQLSIFMLMLPFGLSQGLTVLVGQSIGAKRLFLIRRYTNLTLCLGISTMLIVAVFYVVTPASILALFVQQSSSDWERILQIATPLFVVAACTQIFDVVRFTYSGALRGMKDTSVSMYISIFSFWIIGLPLAYLLGFPLQFGVTGVLFAILVAICIASTILYFRYQIFYARISQRQIELLR